MTRIWVEACMFREEKTFNIRFSLEAHFPEDYDGDEDNQAWLQEWEKRIKPDLLKVMFESLRRHGSWTAHVRNRGISPLDEIEIAMVKDISQDPLQAR
jgi:hypothetical protein